MITLTHVTLETRQVILQDVDFTFKKGRIYGLLAINGSGKTTLFRAISKLLPLSSGYITAPPSLFYYESVEWLDGNLSGMDYLRLIKNIWKSDLNLGDEIDYWEMSDYINLPIRKYSLGMKQRLVIAMYFLSQAKCWLMDEITNGLDEYYRQKFFDRLAQIDRKEQLVLLSSHYKEELMEICDSIVTIRQGQIEEVPL
ncbi:peptide ABC transporter ATP-binding protein [Streptococcus oralis]|uniref:Peptide ABC transporter ATP-binding protein n=1 Tax=Streptococcus oralis TaxID=1303 RepID=A0A4Q2FMS0_STROR|nr:ABC transporter ATP-binding protein [Streptococcus oralis]RXX22672.1 peptide ABC transporter ATP-binding protein [Streptococcus oralis]